MTVLTVRPPKQRLPQNPNVFKHTMPDMSRYYSSVKPVVSDKYRTLLAKANNKRKIDALFERDKNFKIPTNGNPPSQAPSSGGTSGRRSYAGSNGTFYPDNESVKSEEQEFFDAEEGSEIKSEIKAEEQEFFDVEGGSDSTPNGEEFPPIPSFPARPDYSNEQLRNQMDGFASIIQTEDSRPLYRDENRGNLYPSIPSAISGSSSPTTASPVRVTSATEPQLASMDTASDGLASDMQIDRNVLYTNYPSLVVPSNSIVSSSSISENLSPVNPPSSLGSFTENFGRMGFNSDIPASGRSSSISSSLESYLSVNSGPSLISRDMYNPPISQYRTPSSLGTINSRSTAFVKSDSSTTPSENSRGSRRPSASNNPDTPVTPTGNRRGFRMPSVSSSSSDAPITPAGNRRGFRIPSLSSSNSTSNVPSVGSRYSDTSMPSDDSRRRGRNSNSSGSQSSNIASRVRTAARTRTQRRL